MSNATTVELIRDCEAVQIPAGTSVVLPAGTSVDITQTLGGSFTVQAMGALFRIASKDADALGRQTSEAPAGANATGETAVTEEAVWNVLKTCYDPEIPVNIVDLGLVYDMRLTPSEEGTQSISVKMTLTAPGCGMGPSIAADAQQKLMELPGVKEAIVEIVWDPPWHHSMISPTGRARLGLD